MDAIKKPEAVTNEVKLRSILFAKINELIVKKKMDPDNPVWKEAEELGLPTSK